LLRGNPTIRPGRWRSARDSAIQAGQMLGAGEHRSERKPAGVPAPWLRGGYEKRRRQRRRWPAWAPKIRRAVTGRAC